MGVIDRIEIVKSAYGLTTRGMAVKCGMNQPTLDRMLKGINALNLNCVLSILENFQDISAEWLLRGEGEMLKSEAKINERIDKLIDTIATLQDALNKKTESIGLLQQRIKELESK